ncbi:MAG TPA: sigma-70 family RNA polymerase sigma factor [Polyangiaceae bacterium]|nr:sigma-70 family RNA polymerase sigma factor [Polyangiaceae bacterium]
MTLIRQANSAPDERPSTSRRRFIGFDSDNVIVRAVTARHPAGAAALFARYHAHVRRVLIHVLGPDSELADLVQEVFLVAMNSMDRLTEPESLRGWLGSIAVFTARARMRQRSRFRIFQLLPTDELPEVLHESVPPEVDEALRATYRVLGRMPAEERLLFAQRFIDGMELSEMARASEVSLSTLKRRLLRAEARFSAIAEREPSLEEWLGDGSTGAATATATTTSCRPRE